ncbi:MAG: hypothetical protein ABJE66_30075 [Deltaproteobacteria bacterium]
MRFALILVVAACSSNNNAVDIPDAGSGSNQLMFTSFTSRTASLTDADSSEMQIAMTDGMGTIGCSLSSDQHNSLGAAGHEIIMALQPPNGVPCPVGTFAVPSNCPTDTGFLGYVPEKCAYYREWDASGASLGMLPATAGSVTVSGNEQSCTIQATFSFSGVQWTDSFTVTNLLAPKPWCKSS